MIDAKDAVVWINHDSGEVMVQEHAWGVPDDRKSLQRGRWGDPIGAAYSEWNAMTDEERVVLMLETAIDLAMQGFALPNVLKAFAQVKQFRDLGSKSYPMCRALTSALVGRSLEPNTMSFEELLVAYRAK
jgi:hypothetical protein